ncbi:MAG TPA: hypothetical protein VJM31_09745 [Vicinamibacterales bacterium]|nr:hypothetical protein [Vicinamibacterales bacterium]
MQRRLVLIILATLLMTSGVVVLLAQNGNIFPSSGNVGIGTTSPQEALHVTQRSQSHRSLASHSASEVNRKLLVAHSGRVRVKVDASFAPIRAGDLLVTSPTPGHAMRSEPLDIGGRPFHGPGTLVGKSLGSLKDGRGEVLVLLTLQ